MRFNILALSALSSLVAAQRPTNTSICDYYTTALLKENNSTNQLTLLTLLVNTVVIGNYTQPNVGVVVPGILAAGEYNGTKVNLLPYFDGTLKSTNEGGASGVSHNFLDDGGAAPLMMNKPSNGNTTSSQYMLLTHLYQYFGYLTGCSTLGTAGFPTYSGDTSMYKVHKFMDLNPYQVGYFVSQVGLAAASFGVATEDIKGVAMALNSAFGYRCSAKAAIPATAAPDLQAICIDSSCPIAPANATCPAYSPATAPMFVNGTIYKAPGSINSANGTATNGTSGGSGGNGTSSGGSATSSKPSSGERVAQSLASVVIAAVAVAAMLS